ncbi:lytic transglycosylase [Photobacterium phosphoreum]|uniref:transglycosylase SLT domain-containing protein n=1 Tax=Photobacterium phosphoreum TaxID=659 RepID=UPI000D16DB4F|nr:transglycosylase SLT domain-containing protein [Photobacterium phosphoreum]PSW29145.1 lytic transglycosylase [Photobacterium phosphoreum]
MKKVLRVICISAAMMLSATAQAKGHTVKIPSAFRMIATQCHVPAKYLYAIALTETETRLKNGQSSPWTWTINYKGKSYFYPNRRSMYIAAEKLVKQGNLLFDVGIMQINWRWHKHRVNSLWQLTAPETNVRVACEIIKDGYRARGNWVAAAGYYHSPENKKAVREYLFRYRSKLARIHY